MNTYKYFVQDGNRYELKKQVIFTVVISGGVGLLGLWLTVMKSDNKFNLWFGVFLLVIGILGLLRLTSKTVFDTYSRQLIIKRAFFAKEVVYNLDDFETFLITRTISLFGLTMNAAANLVFNINGKEKILMLHQSVFTVKPLNALFNEIEDIIKPK